MELLDHHRRLFGYDDWANREALAALKSAGPVAPVRAQQLTAHIVASGWLWYDRLQQRKQRMDVWPELSLGDCEAQLIQLQRTWEDYLGSLTGEGLAQSVSYVNTKGQKWASTVGDVLTHVVMHAAYHRAQIAAELRRAGHTLAYTDFVHATRQGFVK